MNFLELCQAVARESQTITGTQPLSVVGQRGRLADIVKWTSDAWVEIQNTSNDWRFLQVPFEFDCIANTAEYTAAALTLTDWAAWKPMKDQWTCYKLSVGKGDEHTMSEMDFWDWRVSYDRGLPTPGRPTRYAVSAPDSSLMLGPAPDEIYKVRGVYQRQAQVLTANTDTPIITADLHNVIVWLGCVKLAMADEAPAALATAQAQYGTLYNTLERRYKPTPKLEHNDREYF